MPLQVGNAPCSWGTLEFEGDQRRADRLLTCWTNWRRPATRAPSWAIGAYMPTDPPALQAELGDARSGDAGRLRTRRAEGAPAHEAGIANAVKTRETAGRGGCGRTEAVIWCWPTTTAPSRSAPATRAASLPDLELTATAVATPSPTARNRVGRAVLAETGSAHCLPPPLRRIRRNAR
jgi:inosose dehydratase